MRRAVVILTAGAALTVAGCRAGRDDPATPPPADASTEAPAPESIVPEVMTPSGGPIRTVNPPPPQLPEPTLPTWESVTSDHPEGATNPPIPVLAVSADGTECFKEWYDPRTVPKQARAMGGYVLDEGSRSGGTLVQCPAEKVKTLLEK
ncbi:MAG: hypothetical protein P8R54_05475 [Myxococcota bacterium]|nr:hypothetical protein [Myxococcota bacterium]